MQYHAAEKLSVEIKWLEDTLIICKGFNSDIKIL